MPRERTDSSLPLVNTVNVENRKKKIHCGRWDGPSYWFFKFICPIVILVHFLYSLSDKTGLEFWVPISFGLFASWLNSLLSLWKSCRLEKMSRFTDWGPSEWKRTLVRWIFHLIPLSSIFWEWDVLELKRECAAAKREADDDKFVRLFDRLVSTSKQHTFLENIGNTFGQGPQLFFSLYLISQAIHSKLDPLSDYKWWMDVGEVLLFSIPACAWVVVCNRTSANLAKDEEKEMSTKHTVLLFTSLYLILLGLFTPRAMFSAHSTSKFWIFFGTHLALICIGFLVYYWLVKSARRNVTKNVFYPAIVAVASFFSFADYRSDQVDFHDGIYYAAPFLMNLFVLIVLGLPSVSTLFKYLYSVSLAMHFAGLMILCYCSTFRLDVVSNADVVGGSTPSSSNSIWTPLTHFVSCFCNFSVGFYSLVLETSFSLLSWFNELRNRAFRRLQDDEPVGIRDARMEDGLDEQQPAAPVHFKTDSEPEMVLTHRRHPPLKEWKDMNELLSDGDLRDKAKDAIRRKDLNWICRNMKMHLFQVLTLMLADGGADVNARNKYGMSPIAVLLHNYGENDLPKILELLINNGAEVKSFEAFKMTMLHFVCQRYSHDNMKDVVDLLINAGVPVDAKDYFGNTALDLLVEYYEHDNMKDVVDLLIKSCVPVHAKNNDGDTALHKLTKWYKHDNMKDVVDLLIKGGVSVEVQDKRGDTALHILIRKYEHANMKDIVDLLIEKGVPVDAKNIFGETALHFFARYYKHDNLEDVVDLLIKGGAQVDAKNEYGETALHCLVGNDCHADLKESVDLLIGKGIPVDAKDCVGNTALHRFAQNYEHDNLEEIVRLLLAKRAPLDLQNYFGLTPLMELCGNKFKVKHIGVFSLLTPDARYDPLLSDTIEVTRLIEEFREKKISPKNLEGELERIRKDVMEKCRKQK